MDQGSYDPRWVTEFYNSYGEQEWTRLSCRPQRFLQFLIHAQILKEHLKSGDRVLEVGPGPGRFTQFMAELGARIVALDISPVQLDLLRAHGKEEGFDQAVESYHQQDFCDLSAFADGSFDLVCALGGPLSYVFERREMALRECLRVVKPGGFVILGVMSLWGSVHQYLTSVLSEPKSESDRLTETGDHFADHHCHTFRAEELAKLIADSGGQVVLLSASSALGTCCEAEVEEAYQDSDRWAQLVDLEIRACRSPGMLEAGTHLIAVCRKPAPNLP